MGRNQRAERRNGGNGVHQRHARDLPGQRQDPGTPHHHQGRGSGKHCAGRRDNGNLRARRNAEAVADASGKVDRAIRGAAYAVGAEVEIRDVGGYAPLAQNGELSALFADNARAFLPQDRIISGADMVGSTDMGDVSQAIPAIQPTCGGYSGGRTARISG